MPPSLSQILRDIASWVEAIEKAHSPPQQETPFPPTRMAPPPKTNGEAPWKSDTSQTPTGPREVNSLRPQARSTQPKRPTVQHLESELSTAYKQQIADYFEQHKDTYIFLTDIRMLGKTKDEQDRFRRQFNALRGIGVIQGDKNVRGKYPREIGHLWMCSTYNAIEEERELRKQWQERHPKANMRS
jgi:hypothetical protein